MNEITLAVKTIVDEADDMRNAYFFTPPRDASGRRSYEKRHSHDLVEWTEGGHEYSAKYIVSCSCNNVYASGIYMRDGKLTTLLAIRNSLKRMMKADGMTEN